MHKKQHSNEDFMAVAVCAMSCVTAREEEYAHGLIMRFGKTKGKKTT